MPSLFLILPPVHTPIRTPVPVSIGLVAGFMATHYHSSQDDGAALTSLPVLDVFYDEFNTVSATVTLRSTVHWTTLTPDWSTVTSSPPTSNTTAAFSTAEQE
ncbi:hypothetical protein CHU98_g7364 [Xylaria longipes]|nr:hypothetical protein CHU98_g7364 [Xylaria longipes]